MRISRARQAVQVIFFILFVYAGFFITKTHVDSAIMPFVAPPANTPKPDYLTPRTQYEEVFDTYFPTRTCRYMEKEPRLFRACSIHFFTEVPIYGVPLYDFLPHLLFFLILAFLFSRVLCGWVCPLGAIQDFLAWIRKMLKLDYVRLPRLFYRLFENFRYIWLAFIFFMAVAIVVPLFGLTALQKELNVLACNTCPGRFIFPLMTLDTPLGWAFYNPIAATISVVSIIFLSIFILSFFGRRLWCKICPSGALLSLFNKGSATSKEKDAKKCTKCGVCERVCPMENKKVFEEKTKKIVNSENCINCFRCVDKCPETGCLRVKFFKWTIFESKYHAKKPAGQKRRRTP